MTAPNEPAPDHSAGWLGWLDGMTPEEWAAQFAARPVVARPVVMPMAAEESAFREELTEQAQKITDRMNSGEIGPGLPPGYRFDFTPTGTYEAAAWFPEQAGAAPEPTPDGFLGTPENDLTVRKLSAVIEVPDELLMDYGVIPDTRPKPAPPTWRTRFRWKRAEWRDRAARRAYKVIAGDWPDDGTDW